MLGSLYEGSMRFAVGSADLVGGTDGPGLSLGSLVVGSAAAPWGLVQGAAQALGIPLEWLFPVP